MAEHHDLCDLFFRVARNDDIKISKGLFEEGWVLGQVRIQEAKLFPVELVRDLLCTAEVQHAEFVTGDQKVSWVRISMEEVQVMDLMTVEVPEGLSDKIAFYLSGLTIGKTIEWHAVDPLHGQDVAGGEFRVVSWETQVRKMG